MKATSETMTTADNTEWIINDLIARDSQVTLFGKPGIGKSLLALDIAIRISHTEPVLFLDYEMSLPALKDRMDAFGGYEPLDNGLHYHIFARDDVPPLDTPEGSEALAILLGQYGAKILFIDAMAGAVKGGENDNDTYREFDQHTGSKMRQHAITTIRIDHSSIKSDQHEGPRGASRKIDDVDLAWELQKTGVDGHFMLKNRKNRVGSTAHQISVTRDNDPLRFNIQGSMDLTPQELAIIQVADEAGIPTDIGRARLKQHLAGTAYEHTRNETLQNVVRARKAGIGDSPGDTQLTVPPGLGDSYPPLEGGTVPAQPDLPIDADEEGERPTPF